MINNLKKLRKQAGLTQISLQMKTGIEQALLSKYESGKRIPPTDTLIILADYYNASYDSMKAALEVMGKTKATRKIAVLGNMLELGDYTIELHEKVGEEVVKNKIDILITVGEYAKEIEKKAVKLGMNNVINFDNVSEAANYIKNNMITGDLILLKASNYMNFSKILDKIK